MTEVNSNTSDKNSRPRIGAKLLGNWVEERAVSDLLVHEADNLKVLSRQGHKELLVNAKDEDMNDKFTSTSKMAFEPRSSYEPNASKGQRTKMTEKALWEQAMRECTTKEKDPSTKEWQSVTKTDFQSDFTPIGRCNKAENGTHFNHNHNHIIDLRQFDGDVEVNDEPITFWSTSRGNGYTFISSQNPENGFRRSTKFSQPIKEYNKTQYKDF